MNHPFPRQCLRLVWAIVLAALTCASAGAASHVAAEVAAIRPDVRLHPGRALERLERLDEAARLAPVPDRGEYMTQLGYAQMHSGLTERAAGTARRLLALADVAGDVTLRVKGLVLHANVLAAMNQREEAHQLIWDAHRLAETVDDMPLRLHAAISAGQAHAEAGHYQDALALLLATADTARERGLDDLTIGALQTLADLYDTMGDPQRGLRAIDEALELARRTGKDGQLAALRITEFGLANAVSDTRRALAALKGALAWAKAHDVDEVASIASGNLAQMELDMHDPDGAYRHAGEALRLASFNGDDRVANAARMIRGLACLMLGRIEEGKRYLERAVAYVEHGGDKPQYVSDLDQYSRALELAGDNAGALRVARRARSMSEELNSEQRSRAVAEVQAKYEAGKRQEKLDHLERENKIRREELARERKRMALIVALALAASLAAVLLAVLLGRLRRAHHQLRQLSIRDPLTTLYNRRYFQHIMTTRLAAHKARAQQPGHVSMLVMLDIDHFKRVNDTHGHAAGDAVLQGVAAALRSILRETDMIVRWGGEEFLVYIETLPQPDVDDVARRILSGIAATVVAYDGTTIPVTVSVGFTQLPLAGACDLPLDRAVALADQALYLAKHGGRNRACGLRRVADVDAPTLRHIEHHLGEAAGAGLVDLISVTA